jgi:hypothetical protein
MQIAMEKIVQRQQR